jgi:hypothetical protein
MKVTPPNQGCAVFLYRKDRHAIYKKDRGSLEKLPAAAFVDRYAVV